jgi:UDP-glucose 4-epimerase
MKILVTGGAGFIGSHVCDLLISKEHDVFIIDNLSNGKEENINPHAVFYREDLGNYDGVKKIFEKEKPEVVYHLAAHVNVRKSVENPMEDARQNIINSLNLLELCREFKIKKFIFSSTGGAIYGESKEIPTLEENPQYPVSPYGCAKLAVERYIHFYNQVYGLNFNILRYANVYGPRQNPHGESGVISVFFEKMLSGQSPLILGGLQTRDFVFVEDVARANLLALKTQKNGTYNVGTSAERDIIEVFSKINILFKNKFDPIYGETPTGEQKRSCLSYQKIKKELGWEPLVSLDEGLEKLYVWKLKRLNKFPIEFTPR